MDRQASRRGRRRGRHVRLGSLLRLRVRLFGGLAGLVARCLEELNCCPTRRTTTRRRRSHKMAVSHGDRRHHRPAPAEREENSLQAEAIADCLEFIKRSYLPAAAGAGGDRKPDR